MARQMLKLAERPETRNVMRRPSAYISLPAIAAATTLWAGESVQFFDSSHPQQHQEKKEPPNKGKEKEKENFLTGCVDEQEGRYILVDERELKPLADLEAVGFPTEGFAKHMGHKVIVRGTTSPGGTRPIFKVRTIETVSESCAPGH
jgi:hypothetical protein